MKRSCKIEQNLFYAGWYFRYEAWNKSVHNVNNYVSHLRILQLKIKKNWVSNWIEAKLLNLGSASKSASNRKLTMMTNVNEDNELRLKDEHSRVVSGPMAQAEVLIKQCSISLSDLLSLIVMSRSSRSVCGMATEKKDSTRGMPRNVGYKRRYSPFASRILARSSRCPLQFPSCFWAMEWGRIHEYVQDPPTRNLMTWRTSLVAGSSTGSMKARCREWRVRNCVNMSVH